MKLLYIINRVEEYMQQKPVSTTGSPSPIRDEVVHMINATMREMASYHNFFWMWRRFYLRLPQPVTATSGNVVASEAEVLIEDADEYSSIKSAITGAGEPANHWKLCLGSDIRGRQVTGLDDSAQKVSFVPPYVGASTSGITVVVYKDTYVLPSLAKPLESEPYRESPITAIVPAGPGVGRYYFQASSISGEPRIMRQIGDSLFAYATVGAGVTYGQNIAILSGRNGNTYGDLYGRTFFMSGDTKGYEIRSVRGTTASFTTLYTGTTTTGTAIIDPPGSPVVQIQMRPTTEEYLACELFYWPVQYGHNDDEVTIPPQAVNILVQGCKWQAALYDGDEAKAEREYARFIGADAGGGGTGLAGLVKQDKKVQPLERVVCSDWGDKLIRRLLAPGEGEEDLTVYVPQKW